MKQKFNIVSSSSQIVVMGNYIALMHVYGQVIVLEVACKEKGRRFDKGEQE
jgi:hypothetical protein